MLLQKLSNCQIKKTFELYWHPDYVKDCDGLLMDNSISYFGQEMNTMEKHIELLKNMDWKLFPENSYDLEKAY